MSKNKTHIRTCSICKFSKNHNIYGHENYFTHMNGWILACTNECNKHYGINYYPIVDTKEVPFEERHKCLCVDDELKRIADEKDMRKKLLLESIKSEPKIEETYGTSAQPFPDNTWIHCLQIARTLRDMY